MFGERNSNCDCDFLRQCSAVIWRLGQDYEWTKQTGEEGKELIYFKLIKSWKILTSSLLLSMSFYWQFQVVEFCTEKNHNKEAPNLQNQRCNLRSTWEVISGSEDFKKTTPMTTPPPKPTFSLLQIGQRIVCLVLDKSGSMKVRAMSLSLWMQISHLHTVSSSQSRESDVTALPLSSGRPTTTSVNKHSASSVSFAKLN